MLLWYYDQGMLKQWYRFTILSVEKYKNDKSVIGEVIKKLKNR